MTTSEFGLWLIITLPDLDERRHALKEWLELNQVKQKK